MNSERLKTFDAAYRRNLAQAMQDKPGDYRAGLSADIVADKMLTTIRTDGIGHVNKDGEGFKRTCKELKIKHTYKAIQAYLDGE